MATLLLSDLHLPAAPSNFRERFIGFLRGPAREASVVYLLGDIFETWIGDDRGLLIYREEIAALSALAAHGVPVCVQHGNRDFLLGERFAVASGATLLADPVVVQIEGARWLLSHGDLFCSDDRSYQRWRRLSRNPRVQRGFLRLSRGLRTLIADGLRSGSQHAKSAKPLAIMDANPATVERALQGLGLRGVIHGHTHRPAEHEHLIDGLRVQRLVLADWRDDRCEYLEMRDDGWRRVRID